MQVPPLAQAAIAVTQYLLLAATNVISLRDQASPAQLLSSALQGAAAGVLLPCAVIVLYDRALRARYLDEHSPASPPSSPHCCQEGLPSCSQSNTPDSALAVESAGPLPSGALDPNPHTPSTASSPLPLGFSTLRHTPHAPRPALKLPGLDLTVPTPPVPKPLMSQVLPAESRSCAVGRGSKQRSALYKSKCVLRVLSIKVRCRRPHRNSLPKLGRITRLAPPKFGGISLLAPPEPGRISPCAVHVLGCEQRSAGRVGHGQLSAFHAFRCMAPAANIAADNTSGHES